MGLLVWGHLRQPPAEDYVFFPLSFARMNKICAVPTPDVLDDSPLGWKSSFMNKSKQVIAMAVPAKTAAAWDSSVWRSVASIPFR